MSNVIIEIKTSKSNQKMLIEDLICFPYIDINIYNKTGRPIKIEKLLLSFNNKLIDDEIIEDKPIIIRTNFHLIDNLNILDYFKDADIDEPFIIKAQIENESEPAVSEDFLIVDDPISNY